MEISDAAQKFVKPAWCAEYAKSSSFEMVARSPIQPELVYHIAFLSIATVNWLAQPLRNRDGMIGKPAQLTEHFPLHVRTQNNLVEPQASRQAVLR